MAHVAEARGIPTLVRFFGTETATVLAGEGRRADLLVGNNVLAHVPDLSDFVRGMQIVLEPDGVITMEFPHLLRLMVEHQFDTIYHEHFSYFSFLTVVRIFAAHGLRVFDVQQLPTHGGSLADFRGARGQHDACGVSCGRLAPRAGATRRARQSGAVFPVRTIRSGRSSAGFWRSSWTPRIRERRSWATVRRRRATRCLNFCGVGRDVIDYTVDRSPYKQGKFLPGSRLPILHPDAIRQTRPDYLFILPWNLEREIREQMAHIRDWGGRFVVPVPEVKIVELSAGALTCQTVGTRGGPGVWTRRRSA